MNKNTFNNNAWNDYSSYIKSVFGCRVQKISINAGFSCPNRDGKIGNSACIYCDNKSFSPFYCSPEISIKEQLKKGIDFFGKKYKSQYYLAYFQTGTNTYADLNTLQKCFLEALEVENVIGLVIATRPDCISEDILGMLSEIARKYYITIEYGAESTINKTLSLINRGHTWEDTVDAVIKTSETGIRIGLHIILGLPEENEEDFYSHAKKISEIPVDLLKIHQMQILKNTKSEIMYKNKPDIFFNFSIDKYVDVIVNFCSLLNPQIIIERFTSESPKNNLIFPDWGGKKNFEISHKIEKRFKETEMYQGKNYKNKLI